MEKLTSKQKQEIFNSAPLGATHLLKWNGGGYDSDITRYAKEEDGVYTMTGAGSMVAFVVQNDAWIVECSLSEINKTATSEQLAPKLVTLINIFEAEYPAGFQTLDGYSKDDFYNEVQALRDSAGVDKAIQYHISKKELLKPKAKGFVCRTVEIEIKFDEENLNLLKEIADRAAKKTVVDAVNYYMAGDCAWIDGDWSYAYKATQGGFFRRGSQVDGYDLVCTFEEFNQCVTDLTGDPLEHKAWLTALNDMRDGVESQAKALFNVFKNIHSHGVKWEDVGDLSQEVYRRAIEQGVSVK